MKCNTFQNKIETAVDFGLHPKNTCLISTVPQGLWLCFDLWVFVGFRTSLGLRIPHVDLVHQLEIPLGWDYVASE